MTWFDEAEELLAKWKEAQKEADREWSQFTPRALKALNFAAKEARDNKQSFVGVEHLLIGLLALGNGIPFSLLRKHGLMHEVVREEVLKLKGGAADGGSYHLPPTPLLSRVLDVAKKEAAALRHTYVGTEALLLALLAQNEGVAYRIFKSANIEPAEMRNEILREMVPGEIPPSTNEAS